MQTKKNILPFIAVFVFTAALASIIIWFLLNRGGATTDLNNPATEETPTPMVQEIPTETPAPTLAEVNKAIKIQVLNATDINGQAATLKAMLTDLNFTSVAVGNAAAKATENKIQLKPSLKEYSAYFEQKLAGDFDAVITTDLKETSTYDAVFTIGTKLNSSSSTTTETNTATASPTRKVTPTIEEE